MTNIN
jgi:hypothetical protein